MGKRFEQFTKENRCVTLVSFRKEDVRTQTCSEKRPHEAIGEDGHLQGTERGLRRNRMYADTLMSSCQNCQKINLC